MVKVHIDSNKCTGCKTCKEICPMDVFEMDEETKKSVAKKESECIACRACEVQCPAGAIKIED
ncbi:ferredoxin family protein [Candidatus Woesearchaeota archaeon]|nr:ferredoxin family protein [Candidatus Woesearchaeota archaeon]